MVRVGLVDFDTSHVVAFTQRLNHIDVPDTEWVEGATVVAGCPGASEMMPERIPAYAAQLAEYGIELVGRPEDLLGKVDAVMVESQQGARHSDRARPFLERGMPVFVDKPFAETVEQADAMIALAQAHGAPLTSCSALRFDPVVQDAVARCEALGAIVSAEVWTPAALHPGNPGLLHYGIHGVEVLYTLLGPGCSEVRAHRTEGDDVVVAYWPDGRVGVVHGQRRGQYGFGLAAHYERGHHVATIEGAAFYREMLKAVVGMFATGQPPFDPLVAREIVAFCAAVEKSTAGDMRVVPVV